jgi:hypothetical protein
MHLVATFFSVLYLVSMLTTGYQATIWSNLRMNLRGKPRKQWRMSLGVGDTGRIKDDLLKLCKKVNRGLTETGAERKENRELFESLERCNPRNNTLADPDINAIWSLEYTTSSSLLHKGSSVSTLGSILQTIDVRDKSDLRAENQEVRVYPVGPLNVKLPVKVTAELTPESPSRVRVAFRFFSLGPVSFPFPRGDIFTSWLDITYLDRHIRLARGAKGNIFVLSRYGELK